MYSSFTIEKRAAFVAVVQGDVVCCVQVVHKTPVPSQNTRRGLESSAELSMFPSKPLAASLVDLDLDLDQTRGGPVPSPPPSPHMHKVVPCRGPQLRVLDDLPLPEPCVPS